MTACLTSLAVFFGGVSMIAAMTPVCAQTGPVIAIPTRPGIPIVIDGRDASYAIVEGDWGLARPSIGITVIGSRPILPNPVYEPRRQYHPRYGQSPERGRYEVEPPPDRALPEPAQSFSRSWSTSSQSQPVYPRARRVDPADLPPTIVDRETFNWDYPEGALPQGATPQGSMSQESMRQAPPPPRHEPPARRLRRSGPPP
jgi:hypothetical protein